MAAGLALLRSSALGNSGSPVVAEPSQGSPRRPVLCSSLAGSAQLVDFRHTLSPDCVPDSCVCWRAGFSPSRFPIHLSFWFLASRSVHHLIQIVRFFRSCGHLLPSLNAGLTWSGPPCQVTPRSPLSITWTNVRGHSVLVLLSTWPTSGWPPKLLEAARFRRARVWNSEIYRQENASSARRRKGTLTLTATAFTVALVELRGLCGNQHPCSWPTGTKFQSNWRWKNRARVGCVLL